jgi:hypothetical protein
LFTRSLRPVGPELPVRAGNLLTCAITNNDDLSASDLASSNKHKTTDTNKHKQHKTKRGEESEREREREREREIEREDSHPRPEEDRSGVR